MTYIIPKEVAMACELAEEHGMDQSVWIAGRKLCLSRSYMGPCLRNGVLELVYLEGDKAGPCQEAEWMASHTGMTGHSQRGATPQMALANLAAYLIRRTQETTSQTQDVLDALR